jgi:hypothetical protein
MRVSEFTFVPLEAEELEEVWAGLRQWLVGVVPKNDRSAAGGEAEMSKNIARHLAVMMQLAGRYKDEDDRPISTKNMEKLPTRAIYYYMRKNMALPDSEIVGILKALSTNKKLLGANVKTPPRLSPAQLNTAGQTIESVWQITDGQTAEMILDKLIGIAAVRKMEMEEFGDVAGGTVQPQTAQRPRTAAQNTTTSKPASTSATEPKMTAKEADIDAALAAIEALGGTK